MSVIHVQSSNRGAPLREPPGKVLAQHGKIVLPDSDCSRPRFSELNQVCRQTCVETVEPCVSYSFSRAFSFPPIEECGQGVGNFRYSDGPRYHKGVIQTWRLWDYFPLEQFWDHECLTGAPRHYARPHPAGPLIIGPFEFDCVLVAITNLVGDDFIQINGESFNVDRVAFHTIPVDTVLCGLQKGQTAKINVFETCGAWVFADGIIGIKVPGYGTCPNDFLFWNIQQCCTVDCPEGTFGSSTYCIEARTYSSTVSREEADLLALQQACEMARLFLKCKWKNTEQCCTAECPVGLVGDPVEVCIPAGTYESDISQEDADQKAMDEACAQAALLPVCGDGLLFEDKFNTEHGGVAALNWSSFLNWDVTLNGVDLHTLAGLLFFPTTLVSADGAFVDLVGTGFTQGQFSLKSTLGISLVAGKTYRLSFDLAGNNRQSLGGPTSNNVELTWGTLSPEIISVPRAQQWVTYTRDFSPLTTQSAIVVFKGFSSVLNMGPILDTVRIHQLP